MEDLWFKARMLADPETMAYNHAWGGTLPFPEEERLSWYRRWMECPDGKRFYRYLVLPENGAFVGEAAYRRAEDTGFFLADVLIYAPFRGRGYGRTGLRLLCGEAAARGIGALYDRIAADNTAALNLFCSEGFETAERTEASVLVRKKL